MGSVSTWDVMRNELAYFSVFLPISADLIASHWKIQRTYNPTTQQMVDALAADVRRQGYTKNDFIVYSFTGTSDDAYSSQGNMIQLMKNKKDVFGGNVYHRVKSGGSHTVSYLQEYLYNAFLDLYRL